MEIGTTASTTKHMSIANSIGTKVAKD